MHVAGAHETDGRRTGSGTDLLIVRAAARVSFRITIANAYTAEIALKQKSMSIGGDENGLGIVQSEENRGLRMVWTSPPLPPSPLALTLHRQAAVRPWSLARFSGMSYISSIAHRDVGDDITEVGLHPR